ncbi:MAG: hypothetical protein Q9218_000242 [Villophora microphyllina]
MDVNIPHSGEVEPTILTATEVEPTISSQFGQDSIDPAFRVPVAPEQTSLQQPQEDSDQKPPSADGQTSSRKEKGSKKGASVPRLRKACDSCSKRKVKCDEAGPPCKACSSLDIPCTYTRPSRRRGPRNRHADAIKGQLVSAAGIENGSGPSSPTYAAQTLASLAQHPIPSTDSICPQPLLDRLIDDYFKYIHPVVPIPHEPSFRELLGNRDYPLNPLNLALLASMVGTLVAAAPRLPRQHIQQLQMDNIFPNSQALVDRCRKTAIDAHGLYHFQRPQTVEDVMIAYLQGLIGGYTSDWYTCRLYMGQCVTISRVIGLHRRDGPGSEAAAANMNTKQAVMVPGQGRNVVLQELSKRMFWIMFSTIIAFQQMGLAPRELNIPPPTASEPYPDLPLEIDDHYITNQGAHPMPPGEISELTGFNATMKMYKTCADIVATDLAFGPNELFDWERQKVALDKALGTVQGVLGGVPSEFLFTRTSSPKAQVQNHRYPPPGQEYPDLGLQLPGQNDNYHEHKQVQINIQKANFHAIRVSICAYLIDKYAILSSAYQANNGSVDVSMDEDPTGPSNNAPTTIDKIANERDTTITDLLHVLQHLDVTYLEPSGLGFVSTSIHSHKMSNIRQAAISLLNLAPERKGDFNHRVEPFLKQLVEFLSEAYQKPITEVSNGGETRGEWAELLMQVKEFA